MKPSIRLLLSMLLLFVSVGVGSASAQTVITVCHPCIIDYEGCLASGQSPSVCQAVELSCCLGQANSSTAMLPKADYKTKPKKG